MDGGALLKELKAKRLSAMIDVWEGEQNINVDLLSETILATPHIAGYSFDGKVNGTVVIYGAACEFLGVEPSWDPVREMQSVKAPVFDIDCSGKTEEDAIRGAVLSAYDIERDDASLRKICDLPEAERGPYFERLRREYPVRREFFNARTTLQNPTEQIEGKLKSLGFNIKVAK